MEKNTRVCKKCLLRDMGEAEAFENMYQYIANLSPEDKVSDEEYERRLMVCRQCSHLLSGMCGKCGCYVEMRAAMKVRHCPDVPGKW
ncbi:DUF6171 family protein [Blautia sp.]|uniref:DUF6171 family protein n=1 Tax=Blautia sp. TaxID=1955243 RepID=UPI002637B86B|nr:DUF6171 family protein [Blautia sp.]